MNIEQVLAHFETRWPEHLEDLKQLVRIPSVSFPDFPRAEVRRSAEAVADLLKRSGLDRVEILEIADAHPYVYAEKILDPKRPTVLLYAHHDVQPAGDEALWHSPPFEPTLREGPGGTRMYARGAADDKAGVIVHTAAIASYLEATRDLPVNVKIIIEGEEEIGSGHLFEFLKTHRARLDADVMVLTDTLNYDCGVPGLTIALRGMVAFDVEVRALRNSVHSGMWGGPIPDPAMALSKILASLVDADGRIAVQGVREQVPELTREQRTEIDRLPYNEAHFRAQSGLVPTGRILHEGPSPIAQTWLYPSLTVTAVQASSKAQARNIINDTAWARVSVRLAPGMSVEKTASLITAHIRAQVPWGLECEIKQEPGCGAWAVDPHSAKHKTVFDLAREAMTLGYGREPILFGTGGSIPFVEPFALALGGVTPLLVGVEDPYTNAHGENESVLVSDLHSACRAQIFLFDRLARGLKART